MATIDLKGNTNFVFLKNLNNDLIVPRTNLAAVDLTTANGLGVTGNTIYASLATTADVSAGTSGALVNAAVVKSYVSSYTHTSAAIPQSAVSGLATKFSNTSKYVSTYTHSANVIPTSAISGLATEITNGASAYVNSTGVIPNSALSSYASIITLTGNTVTVAPGNGYKLDATAGSKTIAIDAFDTGLWGRESHIELFVTSAGYVHTGTNVTLVDPLEPDAVNDCTIRFHDGHAIISVEDHVQAYMVNNTSTTNTSGSLLYGIAQTGDIYKFIGFRSELNTSTVPTGGATATVIKHIVGNGMDVGPTISGNLIVKSGATIRDIKANGLVVMSGTANLADVLISSGATLSIGTNGGLNIERVYGDGGTINLGGKTVVGNGTFANVSIGNGTFTSGKLIANGGASIELGMTSGTSLTLTNSNTVNIISGTSGAVIITSGAILDLTGNTNSTPIASGVSTTFEAGGATILCDHSGNVSSAVIFGATISNLGNDCNTTAPVNVPFGNIGQQIATFSGFRFDQNTGIYAGGTATFIDCTFGRYDNIGVNARAGGSCIFSGTNEYTAAGAGFNDTHANKSSYIKYTSGTSMLTVNGYALCNTIGTVVVEEGVTVNGHTITPGTYSSCSINSVGTITEA